MKKIIAFLLVFSLLTLSGNLYAKKKGTDLIIQKKDGQYEIGELIAVKQYSLLLLDSKSGADLSVNIKDIKVIKIVKKSYAGLGAIAGLIVGAAFGIAMISAENASTRGSWDIDLSPAYGAILGLPGALLGALCGSAAGKDITIQIEGKSDSEINGILEKLRKKARIQNSQ